MKVIAYCYAAHQAMSIKYRMMNFTLLDVNTVSHDNF